VPSTARPRHGVGSRSGRPLRRGSHDRTVSPGRVAVVGPGGQKLAALVMCGGLGLGSLGLTLTTGGRRDNRW